MYATHVGRLGMKPVADLSEADRKADAVDVVEAGLGQPPARSEAQTHIPGQLPTDLRRQILRGIAQGEAPGVSQAAVDFPSHHNFVGAERAFMTSGGTAQRTGDSHCIAEFPWLMSKILFGDEILRDVPTLQVGGENQLQFALVLMFLAGYAVRIEEIGLSVVSHHFK